MKINNEYVKVGYVTLKTNSDLGCLCRTFDKEIEGGILLYDVYCKRSLEEITNYYCYRLKEQLGIPVILLEIRLIDLMKKF